MTANAWLSCAVLYLKIGAVVALAFVALVGRIDAGARGVWAFRVLIAPGAILLWPLVILRTTQRLRARSAP